jgi:flagellar hook-associated protein 3 FlgL
MVEAIIALQAQEMAYQGALAVTAKVIQPTLLDFLR